MAKPFKMRSQSAVKKSGFKMMGSSPVKQRRVLSNWTETDMYGPMETLSETHVVKTPRGAKKVETINPVEERDQEKSRVVTKYDKQGRIRKIKSGGKTQKFKKDERVATDFTDSASDAWVQKFTNTGKFAPETIDETPLPQKSPMKQGFIWNDEIKKDFERLDHDWEPAYEGGDHSWEDLSKMSRKEIKTNWPDEAKNIFKDIRKWKKTQKK